MAELTVPVPGAQVITAPNGAEYVEAVGGSVKAVVKLAAIASLQGTAANAGTFVMNGTTAVTVTNAAVTANSVFLFGLKTVGGTVGAAPSVKTVTPTTGFTVAGTAGDTSTYNYQIKG